MQSGGDGDMGLDITLPSGLGLRAGHTEVPLVLSARPYCTLWCSIPAFNLFHSEPSFVRRKTVNPDLLLPKRHTRHLQALRALKLLGSIHPNS